jgi:hypothetical protein
MQTNDESKTCWKCGRILSSDSKLGLCEYCINKYGTGAAAVLTAGVALVGAGKKLLPKIAKQAPKVANAAIKLTKRL